MLKFRNQGIVITGGSSGLGLELARRLATGQFGKNHQGDRDELLPTMHGFDEFFGNLYHGKVAHQDWLPTFSAVAGAPDVKEQLLKGVKLNGRTYRYHIDGYNSPTQTGLPIVLRNEVSATSLAHP